MKPLRIDISDKLELSCDLNKDEFRIELVNKKREEEGLFFPTYLTYSELRLNKSDLQGFIDAIKRIEKLLLLK